jgi:hypothetical protein
LPFEGDYEGNFLFFDGDLVLDGDFLEALDKLGAPAPTPHEFHGDEPGYVAVIVTGDLTVHGRIALYEHQPSLHVEGFTRAETLEGGDAEVYINDGAFTHLVYGDYNHGTLLTGTVETPWVINYDHHMLVTAPGAQRIDNYGSDERADFSGAGILDAFVPEVVEVEDEKVDVEAFIARLRAGLPVLRSLRERVEAQIAREEAEAAAESSG